VQEYKFPNFPLKANHQFQNTEIKNFYLRIPTLQSASGPLVAQAAIAASTATTPDSAICLAFQSWFPNLGRHSPLLATSLPSRTAPSIAPRIGFRDLGRVTTDYGTRRCSAEAVMVVVESPKMACPSSEAPHIRPRLSRDKHLEAGGRSHQHSRLNHHCWLHGPCYL
jgi:hypothetical protein